MRKNFHRIGQDGNQKLKLSVLKIFSEIIYIVKNTSPFCITKKNFLFTLVENSG